MTNPVGLLYDYGDFDDDGAAFGNAYTAAADHLFADSQDTSAVDRGNVLRSASTDQLETVEQVSDPQAGAFVIKVKAPPALGSGIGAEAFAVALSSR